MTDQFATLSHPAPGGTPDAEAEAEAAPGTLVTAGVLLTAATTIMANATIAPSLPSLRAHYAGVPGIDTLAGLLITLPSLAVVLTAGLIGWLADRFDRQLLLLALGLLYAAGGTSGLWVDGLVPMLAGRLVLGIGVAGMMVLAVAPTLPVMVAGVALLGLGIGPSPPNYTTYWLGIVPPSLRGRAAGMLTTAFFAGQFASPLITAPLVGALGLPGAFEALALMQLFLAGVLGLTALRVGRPAVAA